MKKFNICDAVTPEYQVLSNENCLQNKLPALTILY